MNYEIPPSDLSRASIAVVQRSIPHYRVPLFKKLTEQVQYEWTYYCEGHNETDNSGLIADLSALRTKPIYQHRLIGPLIVQMGIPVKGGKHQAILADYGWTIVSNPPLFARARSSGLATIGWSKGLSQHTQASKSRIRRFYEHASIKLCDAVVAYGQTSREYFLELGVAAEDIFVAQNAVDTRLIASGPKLTGEDRIALRRELGVKPNSLLIGYLGKITAAKSVDKIVDAFEIVSNSIPETQLLIAGDGPMATEIYAKILRSSLGADIIRIPNVPVGRESQIFQAIDLYATYRQAGLGVLEAMAYGTPVVTTPERYPETELLADGHTAFISAEHSPESFAAAIARAAGDETLRNRVAEYAHEVVLREATLEGMVKAIILAVQHALARCVRRRRN